MYFIKKIAKAVTILAVMCFCLCPVAVKAEELTTAGDGTVGGGINSKSWTKKSDNTWTMETDNGSYVTLTKTIDENGDEVFTYTFSVSDNSDYYVYEEMTQNASQDKFKPAEGSIAENYTSTGSDDTSATPYDYGQTLNGTYNIVNQETEYKEKEFGSLTVEKIIKDTTTMKNKNDQFVFTITLDAGDDEDLKTDISGTKIFGGVAFEDGKASVSLRANESVTITSLPAGLTYTVEEVPSSGYVLSEKTGDSGTITANTEATASFTNVRYVDPDEPIAETTSFKLEKKAVDPTGIADTQQFNFHVIFTNLEANAEVTAYLLAADGTTKDETAEPITITADETGFATCDSLKLYPGNVYLFEGVTIGATYQIQEDSGDYTPSYAVSGSDDAVIAQTNGNAQEGKELATAKETATAGEDVTVTFTNTFNRTQSVTLAKKSVLSDGTTLDTNDDAEYTISVRFDNMTPGTIIQSEKGTLKADNDGSAAMTYPIKAGESITFENVPVGATYRFTEEADGNMKIASYEITGDNVKTLDGNDKKSNTTNETALSTAQTDDDGIITGDEVVDANENATVTFINKSTLKANLKLYKYNSENGNLVGPAKYRIYYENGTALNYTTDSNGEETNLITINRNGESDILQSDLFVAGTYYLVEEEAPDGYFVSDEKLKFEITEDHLGKLCEVKVYDDYLIVLPVTGGEGRFAVYAAAAVLGLTACAFIVMKRRNRNRI